MMACFPRSSLLPTLMGIWLAWSGAFPHLTAADPIQPPSSHSDIQVAIDAVYPALVQIMVLDAAYQEGRERKYQSAGSGAIIDAQGHIVTNHHVAGSAIGLRCILSDRREVDAVRVGTDALSDIAVLRIDPAALPAGTALPTGTKLPVARFAASSRLAVGDAVLAMGCPMALSQSVTRGIVANVDLTIPSFLGRFELDGEEVGTLVKWIGHDAVIFPGNSGGPLVNLAGEIVGINEIGIGLGGAIPGDLAKAVVGELIAHGRVRRAWIGVDLQPLLKTDGVETNGALVASVVPGSPAQAAGVQPGDRLVAVAGETVNARFAAELPAVVGRLAALPIGAPTTLRVVRAGRAEDLAVTPVLRDEARGRDSEAREWGLTVRRLSVMEAKERYRPDTRGVLVGSVRAGGPANQATPDLRERDVILSVDGKPIDGIDAFTAATATLVEKAKAPVPVLVGYARDGEQGVTVVEIGLTPQQAAAASARRSWFPGATQVLSPKLATALGLPGRSGVRITRLYPVEGAVGGADGAGLRVGDVLTRIDDQPIEVSAPQDAAVFDALIRAYKPGSRLTFTVLRGTETLTIELTTAAAPRPEGELAVYEDIVLEFKARDVGHLDRVKQHWPTDTVGALVEQVDSGGWAAVAGLQGDDLVLGVDGQGVGRAKDLDALLKPLRERAVAQATLFVRRGIATRFIEIRPSWFARPKP